MTLLVFRTDSTDIFHGSRPVSDPAQPRMMLLEGSLLANDGRPVSDMRVLIKPEAWVPNAGATATHGITARQCELYGVRAKAALAVFIDMVRSANEIAAWGLPFHAGIVDVELHRLGAKPDEWSRGGLTRTCIMQAAANKWSGGKTTSLAATVKTAFGGAEQPGSKLLQAILLLKMIRAKEDS